MPITKTCENCKSTFTRRADARRSNRFCSPKCSASFHGGVTSAPFQKHIVIPDTQIKKGVSAEHLGWLGEYIAEKKPGVVVHLGDHWDMPSLSSYDVGKKCFEGRRYRDDIAAGNAGMDLLMNGISKMKEKPRLIFLTGNHEQRIERAIESDAKLDGVLGYQDFNLKKHGWEVIPFLKPIEVDGINYAHYFYNPLTGKPYGGLVSTMLKTIGHSFVAGHRPGLDFATRSLPNGERQTGIIAGSFYDHEEEYLGPQGNFAWKGFLVLHEVHNGQYDPLFVSLDYLKRRFGK